MSPPRVLLSAGGYRSGSTWAYNLCGEYVERALAGRRIGYVEPPQVPLLAGPVWSFVAAMGVAVGKAHHTPAIPEGGDWRPLLDDGRLLAVCTVRDWRDVLHSFTRAFEQTPGQALASRRWAVNVANLRWWRDNGALVVRYEDVVARPASLLEPVVAGLGLPLDPVAAAGAVAATATGEGPAAEGPTGGGPGPDARFGAAADPRTLLHPAHVAHPAGRGWAAWPGEVLAEVHEALAPLMTEFGYREAAERCDSVDSASRSCLTDHEPFARGSRT